MESSNVNGPQESASALSVQAGGEHYKKLGMQPTQLAYLINATPAFHSVAKYFRSKENRDEDLEKSIHYCQLESELLEDDNLFYHANNDDWGTQQVCVEYIDTQITIFSEQFFAGEVVKQILVAIVDGLYPKAIELLNTYKKLGKTNVK